MQQYSREKASKLICTNRFKKGCDMSEGRQGGLKLLPPTPYTPTSCPLGLLQGFWHTSLFYFCCEMLCNIAKFFSFSPGSCHFGNPASCPFSSHLPYPSCPLFSQAPTPLSPSTYRLWYEWGETGGSKTPASQTFYSHFLPPSAGVHTSLLYFCCEMLCNIANFFFLFSRFLPLGESRFLPFLLPPPVPLLSPIFPGSHPSCPPPHMTGIKFTCCWFTVTFTQTDVLVHLYIATV